MSKGIPESVETALQTIAKGVGVAVTELWKIFVRQYVVKGISELFTAATLYTTAYFMLPLGWWALIPVVLAKPFMYGAIMLLGNPAYYAINDITKRVKELTS